MEQYVVDLADAGASNLAAVGGKGANLAALMQLADVDVPPGFCVTTAAFREAVAEIVADSPVADSPVLTRSAARQLRERIEAVEIPAGIAAAIAAALGERPPTTAYAVRSSATAEDLPSASFAGQQDSYLDVVGLDSVLEHVRRCWASLYTERAISYRQRNEIDERTVRMAVVVQEMVPADVSGVLFTADPLTGHRRIASIEAVAGLGEALVAGHVTPDVYTVRDGAVVSRTTAASPVLSDDQAVRLAGLGRRIESHFGRPQEVEWCLVGDAFRIVQSRPVTTLFPIPEAADDEHHVYVSVGHGQMMTDAMKPLGLSMWQMTAGPPMLEAAGRLYVDVTPRLASPATRDALIEMFLRDNPLIGDALRTVASRPGFLPADADAVPPGPPPAAPSVPAETDPDIVAGLIAATEASLAELARNIDGVTGTDLFAFMRADILTLKGLLFDPVNHQAIMAGMEAAWWLTDHVGEWLGDRTAVDVLMQSVPANVTSEMGLALLDVADAIRPHPEVVALLKDADDAFLDRLPTVEGGLGAHAAITAWLDRYGMRCVGEIDITRPRWSERPGALVPLILGNVRNFPHGEGPRRFETGLREAEAKEREVLERLRALPDGEQKAGDTKRMIDRVRAIAGYREFPKYGIVRRSFLHKQALLREADALVAAGVIGDREDVFFLRFEEFEDAVRAGAVAPGLIAARKEAHRIAETLSPPAVLTSDGEAVPGSYHRDGAPPGALIGLPVSAGTVEGRARVVLDMHEADLEPGDILVTPHTDPSWTPLFVTVAGLVTEVGGLMTHGAVIAREYGLPAVVGVEHATRLIANGQHIRVHGSEGFIELLAEAATASHLEPDA